MMGYYSVIKKKNEILLFVTTCMALEVIMLSEISQIEKNKYHMISCIFRIYKKQKTTELIDTENRLVVARGGGWEVGQVDEGNEKIQTSSNKISHGDVIYSMATIGSNAVLQI